MIKRVRYKFRLYIAGDGPHSMQAIANLNALCREHLPQRHTIEIVDVFRDPQRALADGVLLTPLLLKLRPAPVREIVGSLEDSRSFLLALGLPN